MAAIRAFHVDSTYMQTAEGRDSLVLRPQRVWLWTDEVKKDAETDELQKQLFVNDLVGGLSKWTPLFLMFLLPVQALLFKLFYRSRRYMEHFAHATHLSSLLLVLLVAPAAILLWHFNVDRYSDVFTNGVEDTIIFLTPLALLAYQLVSMHTVYREGWGKTTTKCLLTFFLFNLLALGSATALILWLVLKAMGRI